MEKYTVNQRLSTSIQSGKTYNLNFAITWFGA